MKRIVLPVFLTIIVLMAYACDNVQEPVLTQDEQVPLLAPKAEAPTGDPAVLAKMSEINEELAKQDLNIAVAAIKFYTIGWGRPENRIHQTGTRWVPNDPRRLAQGIDITYLVDQSDGGTNGLSNVQTEAAIDRAFDTWDTDRALRKVNLVKRSDLGLDPDIYDAFFDHGGFGNPFLADIVNAGWLPKAFFEAAGGPGGGEEILAFSVDFIFVGDDGNPTDINGDNYLDTALSEVYYNDYFSWGIDVPLPGIDVETVALHENGHSLGIGHFGPPPIAVMNPIYDGIRQSLFPTDRAGMRAVWSSWPNP